MAVTGSEVLAIDLGGTNIRVAVVSDAGAIVRSLSEPTIVGDRDLDLVEQMVGMTRRLLEAGGDCHRPRGICVGAPGPLSSSRGIIFSAPNIPTWHDLELPALMQQKLALPAYMINDADAAALGEHWLGSARSCTDFIFVSLGTGVGSGLVLNGKLWIGADGIGAEFGHMTLEPDGPLCGCGNHGCLESLASGSALKRIAKMRYASEGGSGQGSADSRQRTRTMKVGGKNARPPVDMQSRAMQREEITPDMLTDWADEGDEVAASILADAGRYLGIALANVANLLDLEMAVVGGGISGAGRWLLEPMRHEVLTRAFPHQAERLKIVPAGLGGQAGILGAARFCFQATEPG